MTDSDKKIEQALRTIVGEEPGEILLRNFRIVVMEQLRTKHDVERDRKKLSDVKDKVEDIRSAASTIRNAMYDVDIVSYINHGGSNSIEYLHVLIPILQDIEDRVSHLQEILPKGRGPHKFRQGEFAINPQRLCVLIVLETWKFVHGCSPSAYSGTAHEAADLIWSASGGGEFAAVGALDRWKRCFVEMSGSNVESVHQQVIRQILNLPSDDCSAIHRTELGTE